MTDLVVFPPARVRAAAFQKTWLSVAAVTASIVAFVWTLHTQLQRLYGLTAPAWDLGQSQQVLWSLAKGHGWTSSYEYGHNFLGIHLEPILLPIAAVERLWPSPVVPLVFAAAGLAAAGPAAFLMLRELIGDHPWASRLALALALPIPFWAAIQEAARDQFHPEMLALALAMVAAWAGLRQKPWAFWALLIGVLSCKEDQTYTAFVVGLLVFRFGGVRMRSHAIRAMIVAGLWLLVVVAVLERLSNGAATPGLLYYWWMLQGGTNYFLVAISRPDPWLALAGLLIGLVGLPLLAPRWLLLALPPVAANLLSSHEPMERLQLHYVLLIILPILVAAGIGAKRLLERGWLRDWRPALLLTALPALVFGFAAGRLPPALGAEAWLYERPVAVDRLLAATSVIPSTAPVFADDGAAVWLSNRTQIRVLYDHPWANSYIVIDREAWAHRGDAIAGRAGAIAARQSEGRRLLVDDGRFQVWSPVGG